MITEISNMKKETVRLLLAPTRWICLELLDLFLLQTGMKYPDLTEIGKGAMITMRKASTIAWKSKNVYHLLWDEIIPSQMSARDFCSAIFINNLHWRWSRECKNSVWLSRRFQWRCSNYKCRWHTLRNNQACQQGAHWSFL